MAEADHSAQSFRTNRSGRRSPRPRGRAAGQEREAGRRNERSEQPFGGGVVRNRRFVSVRIRPRVVVLTTVTAVLGALVATGPAGNAAGTAADAQPIFAP